MNGPPHAHATRSQATQSVRVGGRGTFVVHHLGPCRGSRAPLVLHCYRSIAMDELTGADPYRPARDDRAAVVERLVEQLPDRVTAALGGDEEALVRLLLLAAQVAWQSRADVLGTIEEVAASAHQFADAVADCCSADRPPSGRLCDTGFALADRVDALAIEVLQRRAKAGSSDDAALTQPGRPPAREARHQARAHVAALRDAAETGRAVGELDVDAAEHLYQVIVALGRQQTRRAVTGALRDSPAGSAVAPAPPRGATERGKPGR